MGAEEVREDGAGFGRGGDNREFRWTANAHDPRDVFTLALKHLLIEEQQGAESLILGGRSDALIDRKMSEKSGDLI
jgi:hypothetical protein